MWVPLIGSESLRKNTTQIPLILVVHVWALRRDGKLSLAWMKIYPTHIDVHESIILIHPVEKWI